MRRDKISPRATFNAILKALQSAAITAVHKNRIGRMCRLSRRLHPDFAFWLEYIHNPTVVRQARRKNVLAFNIYTSNICTRNSSNKTKMFALYNGILYM